MTRLRFAPTVSPRQGGGPRVLCFAATPQDVARVARVERIGRDGEGRLSGFQRPQIAAHIREIRDYLAHADAMLPNAIVLAFASGAATVEGDALVVDVSDGPPGWVVDGQQRLCAALGLEPERPFEFLVSAFLCDDRAELNRQFILVNNTRPLAKPLIYELLPGVEGLPDRLSDRAGTALLTEALNYRAGSSLRGQIHQQTNPEGVIRDTLVQKMLLNSLQHGVLRDISGPEALLRDGYGVVNDFFGAVREVFSTDWDGHTAKTSRLLHGVGLIALGYVMDEIAIRSGAATQAAFEPSLRALQGRTHWTSGEWEFGAERRPWNSLQNTKADYRLLSHHLVRIVRRYLLSSAAVA